MRILVAIVHHWNPNGSGLHASLRPNPEPRKQGLQQQLMAFQRLGPLQGILNIAKMSVQPANEDLGHVIDVKVITDGQHSVLDQLDEPFQGLFEEVVTHPEDGMHLGFEAQTYLASKLDKKYDLYCYMEDDLVIHDPMFFHKISWFNHELGDEVLLLPHRMEFSPLPNRVQKFYIDGPVPENDLRSLIPNPSKSLVIGMASGEVLYESPLNPHAGCFFLSHSQLQYWTEQPSWQDGDISYVSPLESAATLGLTKIFKLYKPAFVNAAWLELQHWGVSFLSLIPHKPEGVSSQSSDESQND